jgi:transcriptional regulator with XRE-family HTH domain
MRTGVDDLDELLSGLIPGDNVVWASDDLRLLAVLEDRFLDEAGRRGDQRFYVTAAMAPAPLRARLGSGVTVLDARPGRSLADPTTLEQAIIQRAAASPTACFAIDGLGELHRRWGGPRALAFFSRVCPRLFDIGAIAYWRVPLVTLPRKFLNDLRMVTQCVLEMASGHLKVVKAEGRPWSVQGQLMRLVVDGEGTIRLHSERALGRLGRGLERIRQQRKLSQADLARLAGVTPSAISQAEAGRRGLSLETLCGLAERLGLSLDDLLATGPPPGYVVARRDRTGVIAAQVPLLDDPQRGLRAYLIRLEPGEQASPPTFHKGVELVLVAAGLVQLHLGSETPVMRAGDAALATQAAISAWRNLSAEPARLFWILRD